MQRTERWPSSSLVDEGKSSVGLICLSVCRALLGNLLVRFLLHHPSYVEAGEGGNGPTKRLTQSLSRDIKPWRVGKRNGKCCLSDSTEMKIPHQHNVP